MYFLELEMTATGFALVRTFRVSVYVACIFTHDFLSLTLFVCLFVGIKPEKLYSTSCD